jgi:hypothetical protein
VAGEVRDGGAGRGLADAGEEQEHAVPAHLVARVLEHAQERQHVLDVRRLEELEPAPLLERHPARRELDLELRGVRRGAEEHRLGAQREPAVEQLEHAVGDEPRLGPGVAAAHQPRPFGAAAAREEGLVVAARGGGHHGVGGVEHRLARAVVLLERDHARARELLREVEDVAVVRAAEAVDALRVVAHGGHVAVAGALGAAHIPARMRACSTFVSWYSSTSTCRTARRSAGRARRGVEHRRPEEQQVVVVDEVAAGLALRVVAEHAQHVGRRSANCG